MESCCDWASLAQHGGRVKCVFSHETGAEAVFAQISCFFAHPNSPGHSKGRKTRSSVKQPPQSCCCSPQGPVRATTVTDHGRKEIKMGEKWT